MGEKKENVELASRKLTLSKFKKTILFLAF